MADNTSNRGFASPNYDDKTKHDAQSKGGKVGGTRSSSSTSRSSATSRGAAGKTEAAKRGGHNSHKS